MKLIPQIKDLSLRRIISYKLKKNMREYKKVSLVEITVFLPESRVKVFKGFEKATFSRPTKNLDKIISKL